MLIDNIKKFEIIKYNKIDSLIINKDIKKQEAIINWIKQKINKKNIDFKKIFTISLNGSSCNDFHKYCDNEGPTLTIVKTTNNKIFGGFTPLNWENSGGNKYNKSNQTFIFSLDLMKKFDVINAKKEAIYCTKNNGPYFGGRDFSIESNMKTGQTYANSETNFISWKPNKKRKSKKGELKKKKNKLLSEKNNIKNKDDKTNKKYLKKINKIKSQQFQNQITLSNADNSNNIINPKKNIFPGKNKSYFNFILNKKDFELNSLDYEEAIQLDNRNYFQYYISLIKYNHPLLFSYGSYNDYNSKIIKIFLFFFSFSLDFA